MVVPIIWSSSVGLWRTLRSSRGLHMRERRTGRLSLAAFTLPRAAAHRRVEREHEEERNELHEERCGQLRIVTLEVFEEHPPGEAENDDAGDHDNRIDSRSLGHGRIPPCEDIRLTSRRIPCLKRSEDDGRSRFVAGRSYDSGPRIDASDVVNSGTTITSSSTGRNKISCAQHM